MTIVCSVKSMRQMVGFAFFHVHFLFKGGICKSDFSHHARIDDHLGGVPSIFLRSTQSLSGSRSQPPKGKNTYAFPFLLVIDTSPDHHPQKNVFTGVTSIDQDWDLLVFLHGDALKAIVHHPVHLSCYIPIDGGNYSPQNQPIQRV